MPKGRGSNSRRAMIQKDRRDHTGRGYVKLMTLYQLWNSKRTKETYVRKNESR